MPASSDPSIFINHFSQVSKRPKVLPVFADVCSYLTGIVSIRARANTQIKQHLIKGVAIMSTEFRIDGHLYRSYPTRFFRDGIEITPVEFYAAIKKLHPRG